MYKPAIFRINFFMQKIIRIMRLKINTKLLFLILSFPGFLQIAFASNESHPDPNQGTFYIAHRLNVKVDGKLDEWQDQRPVFLNQSHQAKYNQLDWKGPQDCSAKFWWAWNRQGIFIAAETVDDSIAFPFQGYQAWANDCIQFAIDIQDDNAQDAYANDDREFVVTMVDSQPCVCEYVYDENVRSEIRDFPCQVLVANDTVRYEVMIPWSALGVVNPMMGKHIGASLIVFDNDGQNYRGWLEWTAGITVKKFTLPFANILLFDPEINAVQTIPTRPFLSEFDTLSVWVYSRYRQRNLSYRLIENGERIFSGTESIRGRKWHKLDIPSKFLKWGWLQFEIASRKTSQKFDFAVWSKHHITEQISYLAQQVQVLKSLKKVEPSANLLVKYWVDWLQSLFASAITNFDFFNVMNEAQKRIDQLPNLYMDKQVFYARENRIVEKVYYSRREERIRRYLCYLPTEFDDKNKYPLYIFLHNGNENEEISASKMGHILSRMDLPIIGLFPFSYSDRGITHLTLMDLMDCITDALKKLPIQRKQVYIAGEGTGGLEAMLLAQRYPDFFAAVTPVCSHLDTNLNVMNFGDTPVWLFGEENYQNKNDYLIEKLKQVGGETNFTSLSTEDSKNSEKIYTREYFGWLMIQKKNLTPLKVSFYTNRLHPLRSYWLEASALKDYLYPGYIEAVLDTERLFIETKNITELRIPPSKMPSLLRYPLTIFIDNSIPLSIAEKQSQITLVKLQNTWRVKQKPEMGLHKSSVITGPMGAIFNKPTKYVYSTQSNNEELNKLTYQLAKLSSRREKNVFLDQFVVPDTTLVKASINSNLIVFGNSESNAYLNKILSKLPIIDEKFGLRFGNSQCLANGAAALYIYPNPQNPDYLILIGIAPDLKGMKNIEKIWDLTYSNNIYLYDFLFVENGVQKYGYKHWIDFGYFDKSWQVPWFQPVFKKGPKYWSSNILVGMDANQLSFNNNWRGGGKGSFTWKVYSKIELKYQKKRYNWKNTLYGAFGQISVQEEKHWKVPEKSNDIIDFDSVLRFTTKTFIDPYLAFSMSTQFKPGYDPKTKKLVSKFANPMQLSQSAGIARNLIKNKKTNITTRLGYAAKEFVATDKTLRKRWTGDESRGFKIDGGMEWLTESKFEFKSGIEWTSKLKFFQAIFSSISKEKDPNKDWRHLDVHWEQMFTAKLSQYFLFNVVMKFIYDRDTSKGGQFLENASLGISYKFEGIEL